MSMLVMLVLYKKKSTEDPFVRFNIYDKNKSKIINFNLEDVFLWSQPPPKKTTTASTFLRKLVKLKIVSQTIAIKALTLIF